MAYISVITDEKNRLVKSFSLDADGNLLKSAPEHTSNGTIETLNLNPEQLLAYVRGMQQTQCLCLGLPETPGKYPIKSTANAKAGDLTRTKECLGFRPVEQYLLLDFDDSGCSPDEALALLAGIDKQFQTCCLAVIPSSSSYLYTISGEEIIGAGNFHIYVPVNGDPAEYGFSLFDRLILAGHGKPFVTKSGSVIVKSLFDKVVLSPEREIFSAQPVLEPMLVSKRLDHAALQDGHVLDTSKLSPLSREEDLELRSVLIDLRRTAAKESEAARQAYNLTRAKKRAAVSGSNYHIELAAINDAPDAYDSKGRPIVEIKSDELLMDENGQEFYARELLLDPQEGKRLPDPIDPFIRGDAKKGRPGRGIATVLGNMIYSHAHCGVIHPLRWSVPDLVELFSTGAHDEKIFAWRALSSGAQQITSAATEAELSELADIVKTSMQNIRGSGVGKDKKHIAAKLKPAPPPEEAEDDIIVRMNKKYGVADISGKTVILYEHWNEAGEAFETVYSQPQFLDTLTKNEQIKFQGVQGGSLSAYKYWERHEQRNTFDGVVFEPRADILRRPGVVRTLQQGGTYNLFQGYILDPAAATSCNLIIDHIKEVWCSGIEAEYKYVFAWLAHLMQKPQEVSTTALVMQSVPGAGKGIIIDNILVYTFGVHALSTANQDDITGRFNAHMGMNVFLYANEMAYTAQASIKSLLKTMMTDTYRNIEAKNVNKIKARNYTSVIFSSNDSWLLAIEAGDRRYVYLTVSQHRVGDTEYFKKLKEEIDNGGREAFVQWLLQYDYSSIDLTKIPNPNQRQKRIDFLRSSHPVVRFIYFLIDTDNELLPFVGHAKEVSLKKWREGGGELELTKMMLFDLYAKYCDYFTITRQYDDISTVLVQLEYANLLARESAPDKSAYPIERVDRKSGAHRQVLVLKPVADCKRLVNVV